MFQLFVLTSVERVFDFDPIHYWFRIFFFLKPQNQKTIVSKKNSGKKPKSKNHWFWLSKEPQRTGGYIGGY
jgi:hypothetical protein